MSLHAVVVGSGGPEVIEVRQREVPEPGRGQVRIRVLRAGVAFGDVMRRRGVLAPPWAFTPGYDVMGEVNAIGAGIADWERGQRVVSFLPGPGFGGYAQHVVVKAARLAAVPDGVSDDAAAALGLNYITARQLLDRVVGLSEGQSALVHGASGGVGTALLDLGRLRGLRLFGTASARKHDHLRARDCLPIDYRTEDFVERVLEETGGGVDAVFDGIGGEHLLRSHAALGPGGTLISFGVSGGVDGGLTGVAAGLGTFARLKLRPDGKRVCMYNITVNRGTSPAACRDDWAANLADAAAGRLDPAIAAVVPLTEVARAHALLEEGAAPGKVLLDATR